jgi:hypothetical protein
MDQAHLGGGVARGGCGGNCHVQPLGDVAQDRFFGTGATAKDLVVSDILYPDRSGEIYLVQQSSHHRWAYFSEMDSHEALVFKQYDSQVNGVGRFTPHSAFDLPDIAPDAPLRESIEIRCLVTYG